MNVYFHQSNLHFTTFHAVNVSSCLEGEPFPWIYQKNLTELKLHKSHNMKLGRQSGEFVRLPPVCLPVIFCEYWRVWRIGRDIIQREKVKTYGGCAEKLYVANNIFQQQLRSQWRPQEVEGLKGCNIPSGILRAVTHPIYLYLRIGL